MIAVVDYGMGNLHSVRHALEAAGATVHVTADPSDLAAAERIVLPGVGAFAECIRNLASRGFVPALAAEVLEKRKPLLGICLGFQMLARDSDEHGATAGLGWLPAVVRRLEPAAGLHLPHMGWNDVAVTDACLFRGLPAAPTFYFAHSYHVIPDTDAPVAATCDYGARFVAAVEWRNIAATQFHPEKSQRNGLRLLENFMAWVPGEC